MPSGPTHRKLTYGLLTLAVPLLTVDLQLGIGTCLGILSTIHVNPDMDLYVKPYLKYFGYALYKEAIAHRKGLRPKDWKMLKPWQLLGFSHLPYAGTLLRFLPILTLWLICCNAFNIDLYTAFRFAVAFFNGMGASDTIHVLADLAVSEVHKRWD